MAECSVETLNTQACENNFYGIDETQFWALLLQLACNLAGGAGGGGLAGVGDPEGVVTASPGTTYLDTSDNSFWVKRTGVATDTGWFELIN